MTELVPVPNPKWQRDVGPMGSWVLSVDLGQNIDPTAIAVLEVQTRRDARQRYGIEGEDPAFDGVKPQPSWFVGGRLVDPYAIARIDVHHLERLPLRTPYPEQVERIAKM